MISGIKKAWANRILAKMDGNITGISDVAGSQPPSMLFYLFAGMRSHLLSPDPDRALSERGVKVRRRLNFLIHALGPRLMPFRQVIEDRNALLGIDGRGQSEPIPDEPVIWCANHSFIEDTLATVLAAAGRHGYILFGSLPHFFNTFDGLAAYINGVVMSNRKMAKSRRSSVEKCVRVLRFGADLIAFPEGVWNKTPDRLMLDLWPGMYRIARETGCKAVPVAHYIADPRGKPKDNPIHTVVGEPLDIAQLEEKEAIALLRDTIAGWYYLMMEKYGQSTREQLLGECATSREAWDDYLARHTAAVRYYDLAIETSADYRPKWKTEAASVWQPVADIQNITAHNARHVAYANALIAEQKRLDFQRRF